MNITNVKSIISMIVDLSTVTRNDGASSKTVMDEVDKRILELTKALKFKEEDLKDFLSNGSGAGPASKATKEVYR